MSLPHFVQRMHTLTACTADGSTSCAASFSPSSMDTACSRGLSLPSSWWTSGSFEGQDYFRFSTFLVTNNHSSFRRTIPFSSNSQLDNLPHICLCPLLLRRVLLLEDLYPKVVDRCMTYPGGINWRAAVATAMAIAPCFPGFVSSLSPGGDDLPAGLRYLYGGSFFFSFVVAGAVFWSLTWLSPSRGLKRKGLSVTYAIGALEAKQ